MTLGRYDYPFNRVRPFYGGPNATQPYAQLALDEIRVGSSYAAVAPIDTSIATPFQTVSVNFQGRMGPSPTNTPALAPTDVAGVVAVGNWNNVLDDNPLTAPESGTTGALVDSAGAATTVTLTFINHGVGIPGIQLVKSGPAAPTISVARTAAGTGITLTFTGRLYEANTVTGPYTLVAGNPQGTFSVLFTAGPTKFYQAGP